MAVSIFELFGEIKIDLNQFEARLRTAETRLGKTKDELDKTAKTALDFGKKINQQADAVSHLENELAKQIQTAIRQGQTSNVTMRAFEKQREKLAQLRKELSSVSTEFLKNGASTKQMERSLSSVEKGLGSFNSKLKDTEARLKDTERAGTSLAKSLKGLGTVGSGLQSIGNNLRNIGQSLTVAITAPLLALGTLAVRAAFNVDALKNRFTALEGSTEKANQRLERLIQLSNQSIGVRLSDALENYAQLDAATDLSERSIESMIKALGRLDTAFDLDSQSLFARNLTQIFTQNFERQDIKEAIGRVPVFEQILESAFGTSDADILRKMKKSGKLTLESFMDGISNAVNTDQTLSGLRETLGARFAKAFDRFQIALTPLGNTILSFIEPLLEPFGNLIKRISDGFNSLSPFLQKVIVGFGAFVAAVGPALVVIGGIVAAIGGLIGGIATAAVAVGGFAVLAKITAIALAAIIPIAIQIGVMLTSLALGAYTLYQAWQNNFGGIRDYTLQAWNAIKSITSTVIGELKNIIERSGIVEWWTKNYPLILQTIQTVSNAIKGVIQSWLNAIQGFWQRHGEQIMSIIRPYWEAVKTFISGAIRIIGDVIRLAMQVINGDWRGAWTTILSIVKTWFATASGVFSNGFQVFVNYVKAFATNVWTMLKEGSSSWIETVISAVSAIINIIKGLPSKIVSVVPAMIAAGVELGAAIWEGIKQGLSEKASVAISANTNDLVSDTMNAVNAAAQIASGLPTANQKKKSVIGGGDGKKRKGGDSGARTDAKSISDALIAEAQLNLRVAERIYKEGTDLLKREFEARKITVDQLTKGLITKEEELANTRLSQIAEETKALEERLAKLGRLKSTPAVRAEERKIGSELAKLTEEEAQIEADKNDKIRKINADHTNIVLNDTREQMSKELALLRERNNLAEALISRNLANRIINEEQAAQQRIALRDAELVKEREWLVAQLELNENNRDDYIRLTNEIEALDKRRITNAENATNEINEARKKDVENLRSYKTEMQSLMDGLTNQTFDLMRQRIEILRLSGVSEKVLRREQLALDRQVEIARHQQALAEIERIKDEVAQKKLTKEEQLEYTRYINELIAQEESRHSQNLAEIALNSQTAWENFTETFKRKIQQIKDSLPSLKEAIGENLLRGIESVGDVFARAFQSGKDFVDTLKQGFIDIAKEIGAAIVKLLVMKAILAAIGGGSGNNQSGGGGGFFGGLRNILTGGNSGGGIFGGGGNGGFGGIIRNFLGIGATGAASAGSAAAITSAGATGLAGAGGAALAGGSLAGGGAAAGASAGGAGIFASLGALLSNPITAIALPAIVGGILLWKHFKNRTEKKLRDAIQSTYSVNIKDMSVLKQIKTLGEQAFGKGQVSKRLQETIKLEPAKELIRNYAETTGQTTDKLGASRAQLQDENFSGNRFVARMFGGKVHAGHPYIVGERRPELFVPDQSGYVYPEVPNQGRSMSDKAVMALMDVVASLTARLQNISPGDFVAIGAKENPDAFYSAILESADKNTNFNNALRRKTGESY